MGDSIHVTHETSWKFSPELQQDAFPGANQNPFIHLQILSGGAIVHDASGRQRILKMDEISRLFSQLKDDLTAASAWGKIVTTRLRAQSTLRSSNLKSAIVDFNDALKMLEDTPALDVENISRAAMLYSLGQAYRKINMAAESEACYLEALGLYKRSFGRDHFRNFAILQDLGALCENDGYPREAAALYDRAFAGRLKTLGNNDPDTLNSMQNLASLKISLGELESALVLLEKAVPSLEPVFGLQSEKTLNAMDKLSLLYQRLGHDQEAHAICIRAIPPCKVFFGVNESITMDFVGRFVQTSDNFDFPADITDIIDQYRHSQDPEALKVIHRLGRAYMDAGLNRDAAQIFQGLFEDFLAAKGADSSETFDAISALCVSFEHLDDIDNAITAYRQLIHMAGKTPEDHHARKRVAYAEKRIKELNRRLSVLTAEKRDWGLLEAGQCVNCGYFTTVLCRSKTPSIFSSHKERQTNLYPSLQNNPLLQRSLPPARHANASTILRPVRHPPGIQIARRQTHMSRTSATRGHQPDPILAQRQRPKRQRNSKLHLLARRTQLHDLPHETQLHSQHRHSLLPGLRHQIHHRPRRGVRHSSPHPRLLDVLRPATRAHLDSAPSQRLHNAHRETREPQPGIPYRGAWGGYAGLSYREEDGCSPGRRGCRAVPRAGGPECEAYRVCAGIAAFGAFGRCFYVCC